MICQTNGCGVVCVELNAFLEFSIEIAGPLVRLNVKDKIEKMRIKRP
jgi:hypothetical protein